MTSPIWLIITAAIGTFLLRFIPFLLAHNAERVRRGAQWWEPFLVGIGPAAVASLLVASLAPDLLTKSKTQVTAIVVALCIVFLTKRLVGGIAIATLLGALVYGLICWSCGHPSL